jgi:hypothetical protein
VSGALSDHRLGRSAAAARDSSAAGAACTLHVQAVFRDVDEQHLQTLAAEMIARAHELANQPECECDVDVSVHRAPPAASVDEC